MSKQIDELETCAARWILRRDRGEFTREERAELEAWLSADSRHREAYLKLDEAWRASAALKIWRPADGRINSDVLLTAQGAAERTRFPRILAMAASVVLVVALGMAAWYGYMQSGVYETKVGGYQRVLLEDGSVVQLNTDTRVRVRLTDARREVQLLRGEAYFEVAHDVTRPFEVVTEDTVVRAVGTAFNVHRELDGTRVAVTEGKVSMSARGAGSNSIVRNAVESPSAGDARESSSTARAPTAWTLIAGDVAEAKSSGVSVEKAGPADIDRLLSWQAGELHFQKQTLGSVVAQFNRYNQRRLEIASPELATAEVDGNFKTNDLRSFVESMRRVLGVEVEETTDVIRIYVPPASADSTHSVP